MRIPRLLLAELRKLWTVWSTYVLVGVTLVAVLGLGFAVALLSSNSQGSEGSVLAHGSTYWFITVLGVFGLSAYIALILGVLIVTGEYRHRTMTPTFLAEPRRGYVVMAKLIAALIAGAVLGALTMMAGLILGLILVRLNVHSCVNATGVHQGMSQAVCTASHGTYYVATMHTLWHQWLHYVPVILGIALFATYGAGVGALLKNQALANAVALGFVFVVETILALAWPAVAAYLPLEVLAAVEPRVPRTNSSHLLPLWGGVGMLLLYAIVLSGIGMFTTVRRDVT